MMLSGLLFRRGGAMALANRPPMMIMRGGGGVTASPTTSSATITLVLVKTYVSRAHPRPTPEYEVGKAMDMILKEIEERKVKREMKWERNAPQRAKKGLVDDGPYRNQDETIELALNLNLDPRKPGQALRGSLALPHGTGKQQDKCVVFTSDKKIAEQALADGAMLAGGEELIDQMVSGSIPIDFEQALATPDIMPLLSKSLARTLGPKGLMPNAKVGTIIATPTPKTVSAALQERLQGGLVQYRTDKEGIVHLGIGKGSFGSVHLLENLRTIMMELFDAKPETFGKGKQKGKKASSKNAKYLLRAHLTSTMGNSYRLDLRTVDPTSNYFMSTTVQQQ